MLKSLFFYCPVVRLEGLDGYAKLLVLMLVS